MKLNNYVSNSITSEIINIQEKTISSDSENAPINLEKAFYDFDNNKELFLTIVQKFLSLVNNQENLIRIAISHNDIATIKDLTHSIKGSAGNVYANPLMKAASDLEVQAKLGNIDKLTTVFKVFQKERKELEDFFSDVINNVHGIYN